MTIKQIQNFSSKISSETSERFTISYVCARYVIGSVMHYWVRNVSVGERQSPAQR